MDVVGALRKYKSDEQLSLNAPLAEVEVYGDVAGFEADITGVMHVETLATFDESDAPEIETVRTGVDLDYSKVGPEFGNKVSDIEAAIAEGDYEVRDGRLHAAGVELDPEMFEIEEERRYTGEGDMVDAGRAVVVVKN